ncbi:MAG TPA: lmo0937 family membrane protein [Thermoanaerobaculia bacterium]
MGNLLWVIIVVLIILWLLGFFAVNIGGNLIHILLVIAVILLIYRLATGRRVV